MGTKYIVGNIFGKTHGTSLISLALYMDLSLSCLTNPNPRTPTEPTSYNFDAWSDKLDGGTDERSVSGLYIYRNIFYMGKWVVGTDFKAPRNNVIMGNYYARYALFPPHSLCSLSKVYEFSIFFLTSINYGFLSHTH